MTKTRLLLLLCACIIATGVAAILHLPWLRFSSLSHDGIRYYAGAVSILEQGRYLDLDGGGQQFWPPGISLLYAALSRITNRDAIDLVLPVNVTAYILTTTFLALFLHRGRVRWSIAALAVAAFALNGFYLSFQNKLWSEPPAFAFFAFCLFSLVQAVTNRDKAARWIISAFLAASLAMFCRYAFVVAVPLVVLVALYLRQWIAATLAVLTPLPTVIALYALNASRGNRAFTMHSIDWSGYLPWGASLSQQVFPGAFGSTVITILFVVVAMLIPAFVVVRSRMHETSPVAAIAVLWTGGYALFLPLAQMIAVPPPIIDLRTLFPLYLGGLLAMATACEITWRNRALALILLATLSLAAARSARFAVRTILEPPQRSNCAPFEHYIAEIRRLDPPRPIATNAQGTVWLALRGEVHPPGPAKTVIWVDPAGACEGVVDLNIPLPADQRASAIILRSPR